MQEAVFLTADNKTRSCLNFTYCHELAHTSEYEQVSFMAQDLISDDRLPPPSALRLELLTVPDSPAVPAGILNLVPGVQVMILENIYPNLLVMNGSVGTIVVLSNSSERISECYVGVLFPWLRDAGVQFGNLPLGTLLFRPRTVTFHHRQDADGTIIDVHRTQFPFTVAKAITVHKYQGKTAKKGAVVCYSTAFDMTMLYVSLSRVQARTGLVIDGPLEYTAFTHPWPASLKEHILELKEKQRTTLEHVSALFSAESDLQLLEEEMDLEFIEIEALLQGPLQT